MFWKEALLALFVLGGLSSYIAHFNWPFVQRRGVTPWSHLKSHFAKRLHRTYNPPHAKDRYVRNFWFCLVLSTLLGSGDLLLWIGFNGILKLLLEFVFALICLAVFAGFAALISLVLFAMSGVSPVTKEQSSRWRAAMETWWDGKRKRKPKRKNGWL